MVRDCSLQRSTLSCSAGPSVRLFYLQRITCVSPLHLLTYLPSPALSLTLDSFSPPPGAIERHLPTTLPIQRAHMQTLLLPTLEQTYRSLTYLYRLRPGFAGTSHAAHCARLCGVPEAVVERAERICRMGLRAWHRSEAMRDEAIVRRLVELELGNGGEEGEREGRGEQMMEGVDDETAMRLLQWVLTGDEGEMEDEQMPLGASQGLDDE